MTQKITSPDDPALESLCRRLAEGGRALEEPGAWPSEQLRACGEAGVYEWFVAREHGGQGWTDGDIYRGYLKLSAACLTTTFVITQRMGACRRVATGDSEAVRRRYLPSLISGELFATVGVSHLATSHRHLAKPVLGAEEQADTFLLNGFSPWATGGEHADLLVLGATLPDGRELLAAVPSDLPGVSAPPSANLIGLTASRTGRVNCDSVRIPKELVLAGPRENVMQKGSGASAGGLQTSVLAVGLAAACIELIGAEAKKRADLRDPHEALQAELDALRDELLATADGIAQCLPSDLRARSNSLVLRASQAALAAAKGAGYLVGHPAGRWCREALFFLVWSCPQPVMNANLCELAGLES